MLRLPTVLSLIGFAATIYYFVQKEYQNKKIAILSAFMLITSGRILFWDSFQGLIDISFSWVVFSMIMLIYFYGKKQKYLALFISAYALTAIAFMFKGLPAIAFLGISLLTYFIIEKKFLKLFSWQHILGFLSMLSLLGIYYYAYSQENSLDALFKQLINESSKKAIGEEEGNKILNLVLNFFHFPFRLFYEFAPWTICILFYFRRVNLQLIRKEKFLWFLQWVFLSNIAIYWFSADIRARYLFMLMPLLFIIFSRIYFFQMKQKSWDLKNIQTILSIVIWLFIPLLWILPFWEETKKTENLWVIVIGGTIILTTLGILYHKLQFQRWMIFILLLLFVRLFFNFSVLPTRYKHSKEKKYAESYYAVSTKYKDSKLGVFQGTYIMDFGIYHFTKHRQEIIPRTHRVFTPDYLYITNKHHLDLIENEYEFEYEVVDSFAVLFPDENFYLIHFPETQIQKVD